MENGNPATAAAILPEEIITDILLRLPVKSLLKFKCVCKPWLLHISSPKFAKTHLKTSTAHNSSVSARENLIFGLITNNDGSLYTCPINSAIDGSVMADPYTGCLYSVDNNRDPIPVDVSPLDCPPIAPDIYLTMIGSCNGLVCFILSYSSDQPKCSICIMNPATRKMEILPESNSPCNYLLYFPNSYSFGYDEVHDDFKVIEVHSFTMIWNDEHESHAMIYSSRANSWKPLSWPGADTGGQEGKFLNGSIHWYVEVSAGRRDIVSLNLSTETFTRLPIPPEDFGNCNSFGGVVVGVFGGCLAICRVNRAGIVVWVMKEYGVGESWAKVVEAPFPVDPLEHGFLVPRPLFVSVDARTMLINYGRSLFWYDSGNMGPHHFDTSKEIDATTYAESLCWLTLDEDDEGL
ncbi:F-box and associated interaction domains-containing protein [Striga asiatica]|uniref:F-box and associated interaction domains-containing protein n=1 Tax=Striga asiatica TaxID=4170 RepID=A0A5A7Q9U5_STRAF|nr:F-box and associated interaction domains-containing protein [Striga asiatica]